MYKVKPHSTSLFVKRKHHATSRAYKGIENISKIGFPVTLRNYEFYEDERLDSTDSLTFNEKEFLHYQLKPFIITLRILGIFPVRFGSSGAPSFKWLSPVMAYSILLILLINILTCINIRDLYIQILKGKSFSDSVYYVIFINALTTSFWIPILSWADMKKSINYNIKWMEFHKMFLKITKKHIDVKLRKRAIIFVSLSCLASISTALRYYMPPYVEIWKLPPYLFVAAIIGNTGNLRCLILTALKRAGNQLNKSFKKNHISAEMIGEYKILWLHWSRLVSQESCMLGTMYGFGLISMLFIIIVTLYTTLGNLQTQDFNWKHVFTTVLPCIVCTVTLYKVCNSGYQLRTLGGEIKEDLQLISPLHVSNQVMQEVKSFLTAIAMNPPVMSAIGFANIDRGLFRALMSTTVTYMIVLLQFDAGSIHT